MAKRQLNFDIYHHPAVARVSAFVLVFNGERAGRIILAFPSDGAGIVKASVNAWAGPLADYNAMRGTAGGYGYDKMSSAIWDALYRADVPDLDDFGGRGESSVRTWFESLGYQLWDVL